MFYQLDQFGFRALWSPYFFLFVLFVVGLFFYVTIKKRHWFEGTEKLTKKQGALFITAALLVYILKGSPIDLLSHLMFTFHMIQMAFLLLLVPQLLIAAIPIWMWKKILSLSIIKHVFKLFTKPIVALICFNGLFSFYHIPFIFDKVKTNIWYHGIGTTILFIFALFMFWPLLNKVEKSPLQGLWKVGYLFANSVLITPACALIIFNNELMYAAYSNYQSWIQSLTLCVPPEVISSLQLSGPEMFNLMPPLYDQQSGGVLMKILQEFFYGIILYKVLTEWYRKEQQQGPDPINQQWRNIYKN